MRLFGVGDGKKLRVLESYSFFFHFGGHYGGPYGGQRRYGSTFYIGQSGAAQVSWLVEGCWGAPKLAAAGFKEVFRM